MNPVRRAVIRAAVSVARAPVTTLQMLAVSPHASAYRFIAPPAVRRFSQTMRAANNEGYSDNGYSDNGGSLGDNSFSSTPQSSSQSAPQFTEDEPGYGLFVRNMVFEANEDHLREAYEKYGEVTKTVIARDARGLSRGYGFVWFKEKEAMEQAVDGTNSSFWHGRRIQVAPRAPKTNALREPLMGPTKSLYIGNIPYETTDSELNRLFRELKNVTDVRVAVDRTTGWPRGFAHADFTDVASCEAAKQHLTGVTLGGRELKLDYASEVSMRRQT